MLHAELACYLVWVLAFQAFVLIFQARRRRHCCLAPRQCEQCAACSTLCHRLK